MAKVSKKRNILIGVCGGIAVYKTCEIIRQLVKEGFSLKVMMTDAAAQFITPLTFQTLSRNAVCLDMFTVLKEGQIKHISLADWADLCLLAPLSANTLSKIANGICDNLLTTVVCALPPKTKVLLAPAMNENMWKNPIVQANLDKLVSLKKYIILAPQKGELACGIYGEGRMAEPKNIFTQIKSVLKK